MTWLLWLWWVRTLMALTIIMNVMTLISPVSMFMFNLKKFTPGRKIYTAGARNKYQVCLFSLTFCRKELYKQEGCKIVVENFHGYVTSPCTLYWGHYLFFIVPFFSVWGKFRRRTTLWAVTPSLLISIFSVTRRSRSDVGHWITESVMDSRLDWCVFGEWGCLLETWLMCLWWVRMPSRDLTDVTLVSEDAF